MLNISVCGKFHFPKYLKYLHREHYLSNFYCSYKIGENFGIPAEKNRNFFLKEYLFNLHLRTIGERGLNEMTPIYHSLWQNSVKKVFQPSTVNHFMIHGNCSELIALCRDRNSSTIGEAVNAHPLAQKHILEEEAKKRNLRYETNVPLMHKMLEEFDAVDHILVSSDFVRKTFVEHGQRDTKLIKMPYGVEPRISESTTEAQPPQTRRKNVKILCVGQINLRKGQYYLIEAIRLLNKKSKNNTFELTLVGRAETDYMKCLKSNLQHFNHIPHIKNSEMTRFMSDFDLFVLPSLEDGFSVVVTEALSAGVPVITTRNNGAADIIIDGYNGVVVAAGCAISLKHAIERTIDERITGKATDLSSWEDYAAHLKKCCENISEGKRHGRE